MTANIELTRDEVRNVLHTLLEWEREIGPKQLDHDEVGLNDERYVLIMQKLIDGLIITGGNFDINPSIYEKTNTHIITISVN